MSEDRLWKFRRPEWLNSVWARNSGVYAAGGLVRSPLPFPTPSNNNTTPIHPSITTPN